MVGYKNLLDQWKTKIWLLISTYDQTVKVIHLTYIPFFFWITISNKGEILFNDKK